MGAEGSKMLKNENKKFQKISTFKLPLVIGKVSCAIILYIFKGATENNFCWQSLFTVSLLAYYYTAA